MSSVKIQRVRAELEKLGAAEKGPLLDYLLRIWSFVIYKYAPSEASLSYVLSQPLANCLDQLNREEQRQVMRDLCEVCGLDYPEGITTTPMT